GGSGANNPSDRFLFDGERGPTTKVVLGTDVFTTPGSTDRGWSNPTFAVSTMPGKDLNTGYGEEVIASIDHTKSAPYDCISLAAMVFSVPILDADGDGLPDILERSDSNFKSPAGVTLPNLKAMGASPKHKDIF